MIADVYIDNEGYVIVKDKTGNKLGKFPLPDLGARIKNYTATEIIFECQSGMEMVFDVNGKQLDAELHGYNFNSSKQ